jgi:hypothetical protein
MSQQVTYSSEDYQSSFISLQNSQNNEDITTISSLGQENAHRMIYDSQLQNRISVHPAVFFYRPPNDSYHYHINCNEISYDTIESLLKKLFNDKESVAQFKDDEYIFCYQQKCNNKFYQVSCKIISPLLVDNCLNKNFLGFELQQNMGQEYLTFTPDQKEYIEYHLKQYLSQYLLD